MGFFDSITKGARRAGSVASLGLFDRNDQFGASDYARGSPTFTPGMATKDLKPLEFGKLPDAPTIGNPGAYQAKAFAGPLPEYDYLRRQVASQSNQKKSEAQDAIKRRFAALGGLNTGAYIKQAALADESANQQQEEALGQIGFQEAQSRRGLERDESGKEFQSGEAFKQREGALGQQDFQNRVSIADFDFRQRLAQADNNSKLRQLDLAMYQAELGARESAYNKELSQYQAGKQGGLFGGGGTLGLGLGF